MSDIAISVSHVSKTFRIPHEKVTSLRGAAVNAFKKNSYEEFKALDDVSFEVKKGEFFGIIGRNGSGKSTLLKILAGIYQTDKGKGKVHINGRISPFLELGIGFNPELSGRDNVYLNATVLGLTKKEIDKKFDSIVAFSELERFIDQKLKNYSSGMQVRLAFSVSIQANREILLMDEVLAVGDTNFQSKCFEEFNRYRDLGKTVVLVTHDIETVRRYCDRAMLIRNGKILKIGNASEVADEYIAGNISDEEQRMTKDKKDKKKQVKNNKKVEITKVEFLDKNEIKKNIFETGDDLCIKIYFTEHKKIDELNFGVATFNQEGDYIFGINTIIDNVDTLKARRDGFFQVNYKNIPLKSNTYHVKVGVFGENDAKIYDFLNQSESFKIISKNRNQGIVELNYEWK